MYDPITYFSKTSKLNPENSFISNRPEIHPEIDSSRIIKRKLLDDFADGQNRKHIKMPSSPIMRPASSNSLVSPAGRQSPNFFNVTKKRPRTSSTSSVSSTASFNQMASSKVSLDSGSSPKKPKFGVHFAVPYPYEESKVNCSNNSIVSDKSMNLLVDEHTIISPIAMSIDSLKQTKQLLPLNLSVAQEEFNKMNLGNSFSTTDNHP